MVQGQGHRSGSSSDRGGVLGGRGGRLEQAHRLQRALQAVLRRPGVGVMAVRQSVRPSVS